MWAEATLRRGIVQKPDSGRSQRVAYLSESRKPELGLRSVKLP